MLVDGRMMAIGFAQLNRAAVAKRDEDFWVAVGVAGKRSGGQLACVQTGETQMRPVVRPNVDAAACVCNGMYE
jgi:hypothetical protein